MASPNGVYIDIDTAKFSFREPSREVAQYEVILGYHGHAEDFPMSLRETYQNADIALHEQIGWTQEDVEGMDRTAAGSDESVFQDPFGINQRKKELLFGTGVKNGIWDLPAAHLSAADMLRFFSSPHNLHDKKQMEIYYENITKRDKMALRTIGKVLDGVMERSGIERPRVVITAGLAHLALANGIRQGTEVPTIIRTTYDGLPFAPDVKIIANKLAEKGQDYAATESRS